MSKARTAGWNLFRWVRPAQGLSEVKAESPSASAPDVITTIASAPSEGRVDATPEPAVGGHGDVLSARSSAAGEIDPTERVVEGGDLPARPTDCGLDQGCVQKPGAVEGQTPPDPGEALHAASRGLIDDLRRSISNLQEDCNKLRSDLRHETLRLDHALGELEDLAQLRDAYHAARKTPEYQEAFAAEEPLVTVCVATFNHAEILMERAIKSLLNQTYKNLQILVGGDCCTDDTEARLSALKDDRISFYNLERRLPYPPPGRDRWLVAGTHAALQLLPHIKGHFMTHLDDDDMYEPDRIQIMVEAAKAHRADFLWHKFWYQQPDATWKLWGSNILELGQVGLGMTFYHSYFARMPVDLYSYRINEPGDWNRLRKIKYMRPTMKFIDRPLTWYYHLPRRPPAVIDPSEEFLG